MNIKQLKKLIKTSYAIKRPVLALSQPGIGKSSAVYQCAGELSKEYDSTFGVYEIRASTTNPAEVADIKYVEKGVVKDAPQDWFPTDEKVKQGKCPERGFIYLDEIADSTPTIQSALQRLLLDRKLGSLQLAKGWHTTASSNRQTDKAAAGRISTAAVNRCITVGVEVDTDAWVDWALSNAVHASVVAYSRWRSGCWDFDPSRKTANPAFCSPRSAHILSDYIKYESQPDFDVINGIVGDGVGSEFFGFLRIVNDLPDLKQVLKQPDKHPIPKEMDVAIATMYALIAMADEKNVGQIVKYVVRNEMELTVMALKDLLAPSRFPGIVMSPELTKWGMTPRHIALLSGGN